MVDKYWYMGFMLPFCGERKIFVSEYDGDKQFSGGETCRYKLEEKRLFLHSKECGQDSYTWMVLYLGDGNYKIFVPLEKGTINYSMKAEKF